MVLDKLNLHSKQYYKLDEPLKLYLNPEITSTQFQLLCDTFSKKKSPLVISGRIKRGMKGETWLYYLQMPTFSLRLKETDYDTRNLGCSSFRFGEGGRNKDYNNPYSRMFLLEASQGISLIYEKQLYHMSTDGSWSIVPDTENADWGMELTAYEALLDRMTSYFTEEEEFVRSQHVSAQMNERILEPFDAYTQKEHEYETRKVDFEDGVPFTRWEAGSASRGKSSLILTVPAAKADPETCKLSVGQRIAIYGPDTSDTGLRGLLVEIDTESTDDALFTLDFHDGLELSRLPDQGRLFVVENDKQLRIRKAVSRNIRSGKTPAKYMYKTFHDFSVRGYEDLQMHPDLVKFLHSRMGKQFPPNEMQLEAIVKGILTEDLLLVLGPPGTGKTTVIVSWVEYYLSQGKRVLVSSQNNAAVDNVLERLGEDKSIEIVRLGREEKVQDNCKQYIDDRKVDTMRKECSSNGKRLEEQIARECDSIHRYIDALQELMTLNTQRIALNIKLKQAKEYTTAQISQIKTLKQNLCKSQDTIQDYATTAARYNIFLEESKRQPFLIRLLQFGMRRKAAREIGYYERSMKELARKIRPQERAYANAVHQLKLHLKDYCAQHIPEQLRDNLLQIDVLTQRIVTGLNGEKPLTPVFESELRYLKQAKKAYLKAEALKDSLKIEAEIRRMEKILESAQKILKASRHWVNTALENDQNNIFIDILLDVCQVVGATCIGINSNKKFSDVDFDVTIIDESGQIQIHNALVPMSRSPKTLMLGDYKQIPPIVNDEILEICRQEDISTDLFSQSFFEYLFEKMRKNEIRRLVNKPQGWIDPNLLDEDGDIDEDECREHAKVHMLQPTAAGYIGTPLEQSVHTASGKTETLYSSRYSEEDVESFIQKITNDPKKIVNLNSQFRMPGNISDVISEWFYESNYFSSYSMKRFRPVVPHTGLPMVVINTAGMAGRFESQPENKMGYHNHAEAELVADILAAVLAGKSESERLEYRKSLDKQLGVISAYGAQVRLIRQKLKSRLGFTDSEASTSVASLDSFQGQERDLIIYSLTRSGKTPSRAARVGFLKELRRLNVAFTRCKKQLVIIGDLDYLQSCRYVKLGEDDCYEDLPCADTQDDVIGNTHINQCAECPLDCERRFSRFFRLLMQHVTKEGAPAGDLFAAEEFKKILKEETGYDT